PALQGPTGGLAAGTGSIDEHTDRAHTAVGGLGGGVLRGDLGGERRRLARAAEALGAGRRPRDDGARLVGDRDDRVVEGRLNVDQTIRDVLPDLLDLCWCRGCHFSASLSCASDPYGCERSYAYVRDGPA